MQRWHLSLGLALVAVTAAGLAPQLMPARTPTLVDHPAPVDASGRLVLEAGLDRSAVLTGQANERLLVVRVSGEPGSGPLQRRPVDVGVVLDASGSMSAQGKIDFAKRGALRLAQRVQPVDSYSLVVFADHARVVVPATTDVNALDIGRAIDRIYEGGGTNLYAGIEQGANQVHSALRDGHVGRVIIMSDGHANAGVVDPAAFTRAAAALASQGVTVSTVGLGLDYNEDLLARIADVGGGSYDFVDDPRELEAAFSDELEAAGAVVARQVHVAIDLPAHVEGLDVFGYEAQRTARGWSVYLGDVYGNSERKIVARVRIGATGTEPSDVASIRAEYLDLVTERAASARVSVQAHPTRDPRALEASVAPEWALDAHRAYGNWYLDQSTRAYQRGDRAGSRTLLERGKQVLQQASEDLEAPELDADLKALREVGYDQGRHAPASAEGRRLIKGNKERFRVLSR